MTAALHLEVTDLVAGYAPDVPILRGMSLSVHTGEIVTVLGPNGAGKSTLIKAIAGLVPTSSGAIRVRGNNIMGLATHRLVTAGVAYVPQIDNIFPALSIDENLEVGFVNFANTNLEQMRDDIYVRYPDLKRRSKDRAGTLSGGQRQMLAMARALMSSPSILLLDEPSAGLAPALVDQLFDELVKINQVGVTILMVEQNARRALGISDYGYVLDMGRNRHEGIGTSLVNDPEIVGIYLGKK